MEQIEVDGEQVPLESVLLVLRIEFRVLPGSILEMESPDVER